MADDTDEIEIFPRSVEEVAGRYFVLGTIMRRLEIEFEMVMDPTANQFEEETRRFNLYSWARMELKPWIEDEEIAFLKTPAGKIDSDVFSEFTSDIERAVALAWALHVIAAGHLSLVPEHAIQAEMDRVLQSTPEPWDKPRSTLKRLKLRSAEELWDEQQRWFLVSLRATINLIEDEKERSEALADLITAGSDFQMPMRDGDLVILDRPFSSLDQDQLDRVTNTAIAFEQALSWVCVITDGWNEAPEDVSSDDDTD
jgi:hypothetical protein